MGVASTNRWAIVARRLCVVLRSWSIQKSILKDASKGNSSVSQLLLSVHPIPGKGGEIVAHELLTPLLRLSLAALAGALVGLERTYNGRPAGFRTHTLVATASSLLMLFTVFQFELLKDAPADVLRADPTRMAQGIMTGIGFLGAGVIVREGLNVRGLTTAASIWMTAAIGILIGVGFYAAASVGEMLALGALSILRRIESLVPTLYFARLTMRFLVQDRISEMELRRLITPYGVAVSNVSYSLEEAGRVYEYGMTIRSRDTDNFMRLADTLRSTKGLYEFKITPTWE
ncbi:MAG: MgtC/SapB family protein [Chloroflexi bacterium]|nr:MgtC/SapB family protein [Chloroflexota bacterium]